MNEDKLIKEEKKDFLRDIDNLKYELDELESLIDNIKFNDINELNRMHGQIDAIYNIINDLISFCYEREYMGDDEK